MGVDCCLVCQQAWTTCGCTSAAAIARVHTKASQTCKKKVRERVSSINATQAGCRGCLLALDPAFNLFFSWILTLTYPALPLPTHQTSKHSGGGKRAGAGAAGGRSHPYDPLRQPSGPIEAETSWGTLSRDVLLVRVRGTGKIEPGAELQVCVGGPGEAHMVLTSHP